MVEGEQNRKVERERESERDRANESQPDLAEVVGALHFILWFDLLLFPIAIRQFVFVQGLFKGNPLGSTTLSAFGCSNTGDCHTILASGGGRGAKK